MADKKPNDKDPSKTFKLVGGRGDKLKVRLYPSNDGWESFTYMGDVYTPDPEQPKRGAPIMRARIDVIDGMDGFTPDMLRVRRTDS
jgi:hypothetical protein